MKKNHVVKLQIIYDKRNGTYFPYDSTDVMTSAIYRTNKNCMVLLDMIAIEEKEFDKFMTLIKQSDKKVK